MPDISTLPQWAQIILVILAAIGSSAAIATGTPNQSKNKVVNGVWKLINIVGLNVGKSKNAD